MRAGRAAALVLGFVALMSAGCAGQRYASVVALPPLQSPNGSRQWCAAVAATCLNRCEAQPDQCQNQCDAQRRECLHAANK